MSSPYPRRPRLLIAAASIVVSNGGAKVRPLAVALADEAALESARHNPGPGEIFHTWAAHVQAVADLIASINADETARNLLPRSSLTVVK
ncbi:hypothetical protein [Roseobacter weihaiensis]|uniref:hypothetical protein n=1 Tax=Roseobacter weihaiensis TaxID=2763262 RepID=UPI001D0A4CC7|nr:hypothetical protein [Roseobacter sp. H9]